MQYTSENERINRGRMFDYSILSEEEIVNIILSQNNELKVAYEVYQEILISIQDRKFNKFKTIIGEFYSLSNTLMKTSLKTFKKYLEYIENSLKYNYNNGLIEGINRKIKTLKRSAYGYKSFYHFSITEFLNNSLFVSGPQIQAGVISKTLDGEVIQEVNRTRRNGTLRVHLIGQGSEMYLLTRRDTIEDTESN